MLAAVAALSIPAVAGTQITAPASAATPNLAPKLTAKNASTYDVSWKPVAGATGYSVRYMGFETTTLVKSTKTSITFPAPSAVPATALVPSVRVVALKGAKEIAAQEATACPRAFLFTARGSGQSGVGSQATTLAASVRKNVPGLGATGLRVGYLAYRSISVGNVVTLTGNKAYKDSTYQGTEMANIALVKVKASCGSTPLYVFGFSQGAEVMGDVVTKSADQGALKGLRAVHLLADPKSSPKADGAVHRPMPLSVGIFGSRAAFPSAIRAKVFSWCASADRVCNVTNRSLRSIQHADTDAGGVLVDCIARYTEWNLAQLGHKTTNRPVNPSKKCAA